MNDAAPALADESNGAAAASQPTGGAASASSATASNASAEENPKPAAFTLGSKARCEWRDGEMRDCEVIERRTTSDGVLQYYIHYSDFNRRLDEWVSTDRIVGASSSGSMCTKDF